MPDRNRLVPTLRFVGLLALLALVLSAPAQLTGGGFVPPTRAVLRLNPAPNSDPSRLIVTAATPLHVDLTEKSLASEGEEGEQDGVEPLGGSVASFLFQSSFRKVADRPADAPRPVLSLYPLRC